MGVIPDRISGRHYLPAGLGMAQSILADQKEGCPYSILLQYAEDIGRVWLIRAIIES
jgi:hypothetical protein